MRRLRATFLAFATRNFRIYFTGHAISVAGEWMQKVAQAWLVLELSGSGTLLGVTAALQHLPMLMIGPWGGLLADRMSKRRLMMWTQSGAGLLALVLGVLTHHGVVTVWMVLALAFALGMTKAVDQPARQSFVIEMVGPEGVTNAITLNNVAHNVAKIVGPAAAGVLIAAVGLAASFYVNAASYLAVVAALVLMRPGELAPSAPARRSPGQVREGLRYVRRSPRLLAPLALVAVSGLFAYEWQVTLPLFAGDVFGGDAQDLGLMFSAMGVGAVVGGLVVAGSPRPAVGGLVATASAFGAVLLAASFAPTYETALVLLLLVGGGSIAFRALATSFLQLEARPELRGRVMALLAVAFFGTTPIGGPLLGWIAETLGPRFAVGLGGAATIVAAGGALWYLHRCAALGAVPEAGADASPVAASR